MSQAKVDVTTQIDIAKPRNIVAAFAMQPDNAPAWYVNIKSVEWQTPGPMQLGSRIAFKARFLGRDLAYVYEIIELRANEKLVMRTADGPFAMQTTYTFADNATGGTVMTLNNSGSPTGFSVLFAPFMKGAMRKANEKDLQLLKKILETG